MARKQPEKKMPVTAEPEAKPVRLILDPGTHRLLRQVAAAEGLSMSAYVRQHMEQHVTEEAKRRGIKP